MKIAGTRLKASSAKRNPSEKLKTTRSKPLKSLGSNDTLHETKKTRDPEFISLLNASAVKIQRWYRIMLANNNVKSQNIEPDSLAIVERRKQQALIARIEILREMGHKQSFGVENLPLEEDSLKITTSRSRSLSVISDCPTYTDLTDNFNHPEIKKEDLNRVMELKLYKNSFSGNGIDQTALLVRELEAFAMETRNSMSQITDNELVTIDRVTESEVIHHDFDEIDNVKTDFHKLIIAENKESAKLKTCNSVIDHIDAQKNVSTFIEEISKADHPICRGAPDVIKSLNTPFKISSDCISKETSLLITPNDGAAQRVNRILQLLKQEQQTELCGLENTQSDTKSLDIFNGAKQRIARQQMEIDEKTQTCLRLKQKIDKLQVGHKEQMDQA